jgi:hypothetical protein
MIKDSDHSEKAEDYEENKKPFRRGLYLWSQSGGAGLFCYGALFFFADF